MAELYVVDTDFKNVAEKYPCEADKFEALAGKYVATLQCIVNEGILKGDTAAALLDFANMAESYISGEFAAVLARHRLKTNTFINNAESNDDAAIG